MYIMIKEWMVTDLHLSGNELVLFALISGMPEGWYGTYAAAAERVGVSRRKVIDIFRRLEAKGLLKVERPKYHDLIITPIVTKGHHNSDERSPLIVTKGHHNSDERSPLYNIYTSDNNNIYTSDNNAREDNHQENGGSSEAKHDTATPIHPPKKENRKVARKEKSAAPHLFTPPTEEEVAAYIAEKGWQVNAAHWHAYYTANGWKVGRSPMKDWRAAVKTWQYNGIKNNKSKTYEKTRNFSGNYAACDTL